MVEKMCPYVKEPCVGIQCSEFIPRHNYTGTYGYGIQHLIRELWCIINSKEYVHPTYIGTIGSHCKKGISSAHRWNK